MSLPPVIRDAIRLLFLAVLEHQYVVLFFVVAIEEAGVPLPAPTDVVIAFYGYRARGDFPSSRRSCWCARSRRPPAPSCRTS